MARHSGDAETTVQVKTMLPSLRSLIFTAALFVFGDIFLALLYPHIFGYALAADIAISLLVLRFRLRPVFMLGFTPGRTSSEEADRRGRRRGAWVFALEFLGAVLPLLLLYLLPFEYWAVLVYFLIACWPLANIEFYATLKVIRRRMGVEFYRFERYRTVLGEAYLVATGYMCVASQPSNKPSGTPDPSSLA